MITKHCFLKKEVSNYMFNDCAEFGITIFFKDMILYVNLHTGWAYLCLQTPLIMQPPDFMNALTMALGTHHFILKNFNCVGGRYLGKEFEIVCIKFDIDDQSAMEGLIRFNVEPLPQQKSLMPTEPVH